MIQKSNKFIYATSNKKFAIEMGFCSSLTQIGLDIKEFSTNGKEITITGYDKPVTMDDIRKVGKFYLYTLKVDKLKPVHNKVNHADKEYKTSDTLDTNDILSTETINVSKFISEYAFKLI